MSEASPNTLHKPPAGMDDTPSARPRRSRLATMRDSDLWQSFVASRLVVVAAILTTLLVGAAFLAPLLAPHNPYDLKSLELIDADRPPAWEEGGEARFLLGSDDQGRDILSTIMYGTHASLMIGLCSVLLAVAIGLSLGLWAGSAGGRLDAVLASLHTSLSRSESPLSTMPASTEGRSVQSAR